MGRRWWCDPRSTEVEPGNADLLVGQVAGELKNDGAGSSPDGPARTDHENINEFILFRQLGIKGNLHIPAAGPAIPFRFLVHDFLNCTLRRSFFSLGVSAGVCLQTVRMRGLSPSWTVPGAQHGYLRREGFNLRPVLPLLLRDGTAPLKEDLVNDALLHKLIGPLLLLESWSLLFPVRPARYAGRRRGQNRSRRRRSPGNPVLRREASTPGPVYLLLHDGEIGEATV